MHIDNCFLPLEILGEWLIGPCGSEGVVLEQVDCCQADLLEDESRCESLSVLVLSQDVFFQLLQLIVQLEMVREHEVFCVDEPLHHHDVIRPDLVVEDIELDPGLDTPVLSQSLIQKVVFEVWDELIEVFVQICRCLKCRRRNHLQPLVER